MSEASCHLESDVNHCHSPADLGVSPPVANLQRLDCLTRLTRLTGPLRHHVLNPLAGEHVLH
jgi:hypothetical protein